MTDDLPTTDTLANDWDARGKRAQARQREQQVEAFAGEYLPLSRLLPILVNLAGTVQGILSGIVDAVRAAGIEGDPLQRVGDIVTDAQVQISTQLDGIADQAVAVVDTAEGAIESEADPLAALSGPKERRAARKPRGLGKPKHGGRSTP